MHVVKNYTDILINVTCIECLYKNMHFLNSHGVRILVYGHTDNISSTNIITYLSLKGLMPMNRAFKIYLKTE